LLHRQTTAAATTRNRKHKKISLASDSELWAQHFGFLISDLCFLRSGGSYSDFVRFAVPKLAGELVSCLPHSEALFLSSLSLPLPQKLSTKNVNSEKTVSVRLCVVVVFDCGT